MNGRSDLAANRSAKSWAFTQLPHGSLLRRCAPIGVGGPAIHAPL